MNDLRIVVAGHVDHGKSTLIGRLLYEMGALSQQVTSRLGEGGEAQNAAAFAFITDQLSEEQEESFTLDTAQAYFRTAEREYTLIDTPGHRELLKNMVTGTTSADAAILVVDAAEGPLAETYLHAYLIAMLGIRQLIVVINKMDLISYDHRRFHHLSQQLSSHLEAIGMAPLGVIPVSAQQGDQIVRHSERMSWNSTLTLAETFEGLVALQKDECQPLRFLVQCAFRRGGREAILGRVISGSLRQEQTLTFGPDGHKDAVASVFLGEHEIDTAKTGQCAGLLLENSISLNRGDVGFDENHAPAITDRLTAKVFWISPRPLEANARIEFRCGTQSQGGRVETIAKVIDPISFTVETEVTRLHGSQVAEVAIRTDSPVCVDSFDVVPELGRFAIVQDGRIGGGGVITGQEGAYC